MLFGFDFHRTRKCQVSSYLIAKKVFGKKYVDDSYIQIIDGYSNIGYNRQSYKCPAKAVISELFLAIRAPFIKNLTIDTFQSLKENQNLPPYMRTELVSMSFVLFNMGIIKESLSFPSQKGRRFGVEDAPTKCFS